MNPIIELTAMISEYVDLVKQRGKTKQAHDLGYLDIDCVELIDKGLKCVREEIEKRMEDILKVDDEE